MKSKGIIGVMLACMFFGGTGVGRQMYAGTTGFAGSEGLPVTPSMMRDSHLM